MRQQQTALLSVLCAVVLSGPATATETSEPFATVEGFFYPEDEQAVMFVRFDPQLELSQLDTVTAELLRDGSSKPLEVRPLRPDQSEHEDEAEFSLTGLKHGQYLMQVVWPNAQGQRMTRSVPFHLPLSLPAALPTPRTRIVAPLPAPVTPPTYLLNVENGGGLTVTVGNRAYRIESSYSYPHGGENRLATTAPHANGEDEWSVQTENLGPLAHRVQASGRYYAIDRRITLEPTRILVHDTISNRHDDPIGIILSNHVNLRDQADLQAMLMHKFTAFVHDENSGLGIIALDDLYQIQEQHHFANGLAELRTEHFGLDRGASYTVEWAVYPTATNDYYDFINQVRHDEGINRRIDGSMNFTNGLQEQQRRTVPSKEYIDLRNLAYLSINCLSFAKDDPSVSLEGIEFMEYPLETAALTETIAQINTVDPNVKVMFHVAHGLYACSNPDDRFPDSRVIRNDGLHIQYGGDRGPNYLNGYFSQQRIDEGWAWYMFYPTPENSFGKALIAATRYMVDQMGATGMWADGFISSYAQVHGNTGGYSYDRWDGHSVDIDPTTKLITRKKASVPWISLPVLLEVVQIIDAAGGVTLSNEGPNFPASRAFWSENIISSCEGRPEALIGQALGRAPTSLGRRRSTIRGNYLDMLQKLDYGVLYFWWMYKPLVKDYKTLVEHMYPITIQSIHSGTIRGHERIITKHPGVYGWPDDQSLHIVYHYDGRGVLRTNHFLTTVDDTSVRTEIKLEEHQSAVVARLPIRLQADQPVNVNVRRYDAEMIHLFLNGRVNASLQIGEGSFNPDSGATYQVESNGKYRQINPDNNGELNIGINLTGPTELRIQRQ